MSRDAPDQVPGGPDPELLLEAGTDFLPHWYKEVVSWPGALLRVSENDQSATEFAGRSVWLLTGDTGAGFPAVMTPVFRQHVILTALNSLSIATTGFYGSERQRSAVLFTRVGINSFLTGI